MHLVWVGLILASAVALTWAPARRPGAECDLLGVLCVARLLPARAAVSVLVPAFVAAVTFGPIAHRDDLVVLATVCGMRYLAWLLSEANKRAERLLTDLHHSRQAQAEAAGLAERQRLAREMHDVLAHSLSRADPAAGGSQDARGRRSGRPAAGPGGRAGAPPRQVRAGAGRRALDLRMPRCDGVEATRQLRERCPSVRVVVLTAYSDDRSVLDALRAGARGDLTKDAGGAEIHQALQRVVEDRAVIDPAVQHHLIDAIATTPPRRSDRATAHPDGLTPRAAEVLTHIADGLSNAEIADVLVVSEATVKSHINRLLAEIDARDRAQAVAHAYRHGLVGTAADDQ